MYKKIKSQFSVKQIILISAIGLLNSFFYNNFAIMGSLVIVEIGLLLYFFIKGRDVDYLNWYIAFLSLSLEHAEFVGTEYFYGFKNFRLFGINLAFWMIIPLFVRQWKHGKYSTNGLPKQLHKFVTQTVIIVLIAIVTGLLTYVFNDNQLAGRAGSLQRFVSSSYIYVFVSIEIMSISSVLCRNKNKIWKVSSFLSNYIVAVAIVSLMCIALGNYGTYGGVDTLQLSNVYFLLLGSVLITLYDNYKGFDQVIILISSLIVAVSILLFNTNGKIIFILATLPLIAIFILAKKGVSLKGVIISITIVIVSMVAANFIISRMISNSFLFGIKYHQFISMVSFWDSNWFVNMQGSPKARISEFLNIGYEFINKPWYFPFGKGFMGSIKDNLNLFDTVSTTGFSQWEIDAKTYFNMHESINSLFLISGVYGLVYLLRNLWFMIRNLHKSPWILFGFLWMLLFYSYSLTISIFGVTCLILGYIEAENE
jgi:hypothetical protein